PGRVRRADRTLLPDLLGGGRPRMGAAGGADGGSERTLAPTGPAHRRRDGNPGGWLGGRSAGTIPGGGRSLRRGAHRRRPLPGRAVVVRGGARFRCAPGR